MEIQEDTGYQIVHLECYQRSTHQMQQPQRECALLMIVGYGMEVQRSHLTKADDIGINKINYSHYFPEGNT